MAHAGIGTPRDKKELVGTKAFDVYFQPMITRSNQSRLAPVLGLAATLATGVLASAGVANAQGSFAVLHRFTGSDGFGPYASLIQGPDGTLYGTTANGGTSNGGTIFQLARMAAASPSYTGSLELERTEPVPSPA